MRVDSPPVPAPKVSTPAAAPTVAPAATGGAAAPAVVSTFTAGAKPSPLPNGQPDKAYDGTLLGGDHNAYPAGTSVDAIPPYRPNNGKASTGETIVFVNGMGSGRGNNENLAQTVANMTGANVVGVDNATEGFAKDLMQCVSGTFNFGKNPATDTLTNIIYDKMKAGQPLHLMGYSQGAIITSSALTNAQNRLMAEDGWSKGQVESRMNALVKVETIAGGAHTFPAGPKYVHYVNHADPVAMGVGVGNAGRHLPGASIPDGSKIKEFNAFSWSTNLFAGHNFDKYVPQYKPFDQAFAS